MNVYYSKTIKILLHKYFNVLNEYKIIETDRLLYLLCVVVSICNARGDGASFKSLSRSRCGLTFEWCTLLSQMKY